MTKNVNSTDSSVWAINSIEDMHKLYRRMEQHLIGVTLWNNHSMNKQVLYETCCSCQLHIYLCWILHNIFSTPSFFFFCLNIFQNDCHCSIYAIFSSSLFYVAIKTTFSQSIKCSWVPWILKISLLEFQTSTHHFHVLHVYCMNLHIFHLFCNILIKHHFVYPLLFLI